MRSEGLLGFGVVRVEMLTLSLQLTTLKGATSVERPQPVTGLLANRPPDTCILMTQGLRAYKPAPRSVGYHVRPAVPAITQPLPWMSLLCCVSDATGSTSGTMKNSS